MNKNRFVKTITSLAVASLLVGAVPALALADTAVPATTAAEVTAAKTIVHFVNTSKPSSISSMVNYITNPSVFEKDGVNYLRIDVQQVYDVKITVEGKEGVKVGEYEAPVKGRNGEESISTFFTFDYALSDISKPIEAAASYFVPGVFAEPQSHDIYVVINNDVEAALKELAVVIGEAKQITEPSKQLADALAAAEKANSYLTKKADLEAALKQLKAAFYAEPVAVAVHYVNESDPSKLSSMGTYLANPRTYEKDNVKYVRVDVQQSYDVKVLIEDKEGTKVGEYKATIAGRNGTQEVTFYTFDYEVSSLNGVLKASASYFVPGVFTEPQSHDIKLVIGQNVEANKAKLVKAINAASAIANPSADLAAAIEKANQSNSYLLSNEQLKAATEALVAVSTKEVSLTDVSSHWAKAAINKAVAVGIANGYTDGSFAPEKSITRAEFTKLLVEALALPTSNAELSFTDAASVPAWAQAYVKSAVAAGIINGYQDNTFRPNGEITRAEMAVMIVKALGLELVSADTLSFSDNDSIPQFAQAQVATAVKNGLIQGLSNNKFGANQQASRAQAVTILLRALDK